MDRSKFLVLVTCCIALVGPLYFTSTSVSTGCCTIDQTVGGWDYILIGAAYN